jgi:hypothetical protein
MHVIDLADCPCEVAKVVFLGEAGKLRDVIQSHVADALDPRAFELVKNFSADFLVKPIVNIFIRQHAQPPPLRLRLPSPSCLNQSLEKTASLE